MRGWSGVDVDSDTASSVCCFLLLLCERIVGAAWTWYILFVTVPFCAVA